MGGGEAPQEVSGKGLTHFNRAGRAKMVDVSEKPATRREAVAHGTVRVAPDTLALIKQGRIAKGDVLAVAQVAGVMAAKQTFSLIPMCHPLPLTGIDLAFDLDEERNLVEIRATVKTTAQTGVEMEALTAVSVAALTVYDMCKAVDKEMVIGEIYLLRKSGGKSGEYVRKAGLTGSD
ncbi:MAG: cyclic pyranopterin monophosphate synthase MoaC [Firmicutes bacterium]|nr:cyclic pyranopterin monophosphate synthase MoaC [Bacillota bacterium]